MFQDIENKEVKTVKQLLEEGASPNRKSLSTELTPLMVASYNRSANIVKLLLDHGADPKVKEVSDWTALDFAKLYKNKEAVELIKIAMEKTSCNQNFKKL